MWYLLGKLISGYLFLSWQRGFGFFSPPSCLLLSSLLGCIGIPASTVLSKHFCAILFVQRGLPGMGAVGREAGEVSVGELAKPSVSTSFPCLFSLNSLEFKKRIMCNLSPQGAFPGKCWGVCGFYRVLPWEVISA